MEYLNCDVQKHLRNVIHLGMGRLRSVEETPPDKKNRIVTDGQATSEAASDVLPSDNSGEKKPQATWAAGKKNWMEGATSTVPIQKLQTKKQTGRQRCPHGERSFGNKLSNVLFFSNLKFELDIFPFRCHSEDNNNNKS